MTVDIIIPAKESGRILRLMTLLGNEFTDVRQGLLEVAGDAREGITLTITPVVHPHSHRQRAYYWKWLRAFGEFCGTTPDETHNEILCKAYGTEYIETRWGIKRRPQKRSSEATRPEYSVLIDTLVRTAAEMDFNVPPPVRSIKDERED